jgi:hypothetical protein
VPGAGVRGGAAAVWAVAVLGAGVVAATLVLRGVPAAPPDPGPGPSPDPTESPAPTPDTDPEPVAGPPLTILGYGSVRLGGPDAALARVLCDGAWCPDPLVETAVDTAGGCVQRVRPAPRPGAVTLWVWSRDGVVEAVGVVASGPVPQAAPFGIAFGDPVPGGPRSAGVASTRWEVDGTVVTVAAVGGTGIVDYAEVATPAGAACAARPAVVDSEPPRPGEPRVTDGGVDGIRLGASFAGPPAPWQDVSFGDASCRTWLSPSGAVAYSRAGRVVGVSARSVTGGPAVGQSLDDVVAAGSPALVEVTGDEGGRPGTPWEPTYSTAVVTGTPAGRLELTTVRPAGAVDGVDWPVASVAPPPVVSGIVVGESCEAPAGPPTGTD